MMNAKICKAPIFSISRLRMGIDGSGITTLVTFMGCPLDCKYCLNRECHNPIYEEDGKTLCKGIMLLTPQDLYGIVKMDNIYFQATGGGVCFGGGEPILYATFIEEFKNICGNKWKITLETCLRCSCNTIERLSKVVDYWIVDVKSMQPRIYEQYTGKTSNVLRDLRLLERFVPCLEKVTIKVPLIPGFNDSCNLDSDIDEIKREFKFADVIKTQYIIK